MRPLPFHLFPLLSIRIIDNLISILRKKNDETGIDTLMIISRMTVCSLLIRKLKSKPSALHTHIDDEDLVQSRLAYCVMKERQI